MTVWLTQLYAIQYSCTVLENVEEKPGPRELAKVAAFFYPSGPSCSNAG